MRFLQPVFAPDGADTPAPTTPAAPATAAWYAGADPELVGHIQSKGWETKSAAEAALAAIKSHREAEKYIGVPAEQIVRVPKEPGDAAWADVWKRLGKPDTADAYKFEGLKKSDGTDFDSAFLSSLRTASLEANLPVNAAEQVARSVAKYLDGKQVSENAEKTAAIETQKAALKNNWSNNYDANMFVAKNTAQALGVTPEQVASLENVIGYDKVMEMFRQIGTKIGEDRFVTNTNPNIPGVMTKEQAIARKAELQSDNAWVKRYLDGGAAENRELQALLTIMTA